MKHKLLGLIIAFAFAIVIPALVIVQSCTWNDTIKPHGVCFQEDVLPLVHTYCAKSGCHDGSDSTHLRGLLTYEDIMYYVKAGHPGRSEFIGSLANGGENHMPPNNEPQLTSQQIGVLKQWVAEGALRIGMCDQTCDTSNVTYSGSILPLLQNDCLGCHVGTSSSSGVDLSTYASLKEQADNGSLWGDVSWNPDYIHMPNNGAKLDTCKLRTIKIWLNQGAPNN